MRVKRKQAENFDFKEQILEVLPLFCKSCQGKDNRQQQETINYLYGTLRLVAVHLGIVDKDWKKMSLKIRDWCHSQDIILHKKERIQKKERRIMSNGK
jgi:hypothetical protein